MNTQSVTIQSIKARPIALPMIHPHQTASGTITESPLVLVDITTSEGVVGKAIVFTYTRLALKPVADFIQNLESLLIDVPLAPAQISVDLQKRFRLLGTQGLVGMGLAGVDMALWDALARTCDQPLVRLLGGTEQAIQAYGAVGYDGVAGSAKVAAEWAEIGMKGVKAKIGYPTVEEDIEVIRAMRSAAGDDNGDYGGLQPELNPKRSNRAHPVIR